jgi:hypothetical protein
MAMNAPLGDREKLFLQMGHDVGMQQTNIGARGRAAALGNQQRIAAATLSHQRTGQLAEEAGQRGLDIWRTKQAETPVSVSPQDQIAAEKMRRYNAILTGGGDVSSAERQIGIPQPPEQGIPSPTDQEGMILSQFPLGSPEWFQARAMLADIKRVPPDEQVRRMAEINSLLTAIGKTYQKGYQGQVEGVPIPALKGINQQLMGQVGDWQQDSYQQPSQYEIGQVIEQGGQMWKIVGFAPDGEPLVEPAQ